MFKEEENKLEKRKNAIDQVKIPADKLHFAVRQGFEKAKNERALKRNIIRKRSTWSIVVAVILLITFVTSITVSPVFASKVALIPGMDKIVALIKQDRGLTAEIENDFYQPINLSQEKNGITVTLDGVIADKKGMVIFYSVHTNQMDVGSLELKYIQLWTGMNSRYRFDLNDSVLPLTERKDSQFFSSTEHIESSKLEEELSWAIGLKNGEKIEHFKIPFSYKKMDVESKNIVVNKEVTIDGQRIKVKELIVDPIRTVVRLEENPHNSKKLLARAFDELELKDDLGRTWSALPGNSYKPLLNGDVWDVPLKESFYFYEPNKLSLTFGKIAAMDKDQAYILIDTESKAFLKQPSESLFFNLKVENEKVSFTIEADNNNDFVYFPRFTDATGRDFIIYYKGLFPSTANYVRGSLVQVSNEEMKLEFDLPWEKFTNPLRFELDSYPSWIEDDVKVDIK
ncbi:DUF4179 domain-containing protein [Psychrobacillus sp. FJAT-21963]|uniref:DUF4179 domain-containing protein n=1 Tax=Psychrobacillus sp. FJAT-21963 TaxID=1712028 RepID=UPI0006FA220D|nr:DUF4179 domain-containing protein [Psychrobacillus sp. FJAT-21963]KQL34384.1 hypothetical protein AN959_15410 [Psychrobacillus sp. FJAT-21963]